MNTQPAKKILIVEDEALTVNLLRDNLISEGFSTLEVRNGKEGLKVALKEHPDLILLDIIMPVMDGITMLKKIRSDAWGKNAKIIILTNLSDTEKVSEAMDRGTYDYLIKSDWKLEDVATKIRERLEWSE